MKSLTAILILSTVLAINARRLFTTTTPEPDKVENHILGTVDGKTFVANSVHRDWTASRLFCESKGMKLATITNRAQADLLKSEYDPINFNGWYWVAAGKSKNGKFLWVESKQEVKTFRALSTSSWSNEDESKDCFVYSANNHATGYYFRRACHHDHPTLCETEQPIESNEIQNEQIRKTEPELIEIGSYKGRTYFGDQVIRNWTDSLTFCKSRGLQLARIGNGDRHKTSFLKKACNKINYDGWFWLAKDDVRGIRKLLSGSEENVELCPYLDARVRRYSSRPCFNRHFTLCESVESIALDTNAVDQNGDEKLADIFPETSVESISDTESVHLMFASLSKSQKRKLLDILKFMQLMDEISKMEHSAEGFDISTSPQISVEEDIISSKPEYSPEGDDTSNASESCEGTFCW